jgi:hypothetical protein
MRKKSRRLDTLRNIHEHIESLPPLPPADHPDSDWIGPGYTLEIGIRIAMLEMAHRMYMDGLGSSGGRPKAKKDPDTAVLRWMAMHDGPKGPPKGPSALAKMAIEAGIVKPHGDGGKATIERLARKYSKLRARRKSRT